MIRPPIPVRHWRSYGNTAFKRQAGVRAGQ